MATAACHYSKASFSIALIPVDVNATGLCQCFSDSYWLLRLGFQQYVFKGVTLYGLLERFLQELA